MRHSPRLLPLVLLLLIPLVLFGTIAAMTSSVRAQSPAPTTETTVENAATAGECPAPGSAAFVTTASADSPSYDYVVLVDVSGSMGGWYGNPASYVAEKDIFAEVKESLKG